MEEKNLRISARFQALIFMGCRAGFTGQRTDVPDQGRHIRESGGQADRDQRAARNLECSYEIVDFQHTLLYLSATVLRLFKKQIGIGLPIVLAVVVASAASLLIVTREPRFIPVSGGGSINISTDLLGPGEAKFYSYRDRAGAELRFILARD